MFRLKPLKGSNFLVQIGTKIKFPEKFKGTLIEKWADYWKNLFTDYRQMLQDLRTDIQDEPKKAMVWTTCITTLYALSKNNPNEMDFKDNIKRIANEVGLVSNECRNKKFMDYLNFLESSYNAGLVHYKSLGIISIMYITNLNDSCDLYKSQCSYLKPRFISFPSSVIDIGFMGRWWNFYIKSTNYDVNM